MAVPVPPERGWSMRNTLANGQWRRVSRAHPCPVCGRPDWCLYAGPAGDPEAVICPRVESDKRCGEAGWLHRLRDKPWKSARRVVRSVSLGGTCTRREDLARVTADYQAHVDPGRLHQLALSLGLTTESLLALGIGWFASHRAWTFPMRDACEQVLGIRLRYPDGRKLSVRGGREGLFLPRAGTPDGSALVICEGPTDTAALLDLGFLGAVGRPSCTGGIRLLVELQRHWRSKEVVIVADTDEPGQRGADNLASVLVAYASVVRVISPPAGAKDAREWLRSGATRQNVEQVIDAAEPRRLSIRTRRVRHGR